MSGLAKWWVGLFFVVFVAAACAPADPQSSAPPGATASAPRATATAPGATASAIATEVAVRPTASADPRKPDLAGMFDVGGYSLYLECHGTAGPVVLFEAGSGSNSTSWHRSPKDFIGLVDNSYRRCLYDRANLGKSERVAGPRTSATAARDLHALLAAAGLAPPYVLVGRSFGGYNVRLFAAAYPSDVQGLVLIETLTPAFQDGMLDLLTPDQRTREVRSFETIEPPMDELAGGPLVAAAGLPDVPLLVVAGTKWHSGNEPWPNDWPGPALDALWDKSQVDLASGVPRGRLVVFEGGDHALHFSEPERLAAELNEFLAAL